MSMLTRKYAPMPGLGVMVVCVPGCRNSRFGAILKCGGGNSRSIINFNEHVGVSKNRGTPKWMVYNGKPYSNGWFGDTIIFENTHVWLNRVVEPSMSSSTSSCILSGLASGHVCFLGTMSGLDFSLMWVSYMDVFVGILDSMFSFQVSEFVGFCLLFAQFQRVGFQGNFCRFLGGFLKVGGSEWFLRTQWCLKKRLGELDDSEMMAEMSLSIAKMVASKVGQHEPQSLGWSVK